MWSTKPDLSRDVNILCRHILFFFFALQIFVKQKKLLNLNRRNKHRHSIQTKQRANTLRGFVYNQYQDKRKRERVNGMDLQLQVALRS